MLTAFIQSLNLFYLINYNRCLDKNNTGIDSILINRKNFFKQFATFETGFGIIIT